MSSGSSILARNSCPPRRRNAERVYSAPARDFLRDLNLGYFDRWAKNPANPACRCRNACCSGTLDTSDKNASSSVFFHAVRAAEDSTYVILRPSAR